MHIINHPKNVDFPKRTPIYLVKFIGIWIINKGCTKANSVRAKSQHMHSVRTDDIQLQGTFFYFMPELEKHVAKNSKYAATFETRCCIECTAKINVVTRHVFDAVVH